MTFRILYRYKGMRGSLVSVYTCQPQAIRNILARQDVHVIGIADEHGNNVEAYIDRHLGPIKARDPLNIEAAREAARKVRENGLKGQPGW